MGTGYSGNPVPGGKNGSEDGHYLLYLSIHHRLHRHLVVVQYLNHPTPTGPDCLETSHSGPVDSG